MLVLPVIICMISTKNIFLVSSEYTVNLIKAYKISLQSCQIYFLGSVKPELHSRHIPTPTSFLRKWKRWPSHYLWKKAWYLLYWQYTTLKIPWSYHQLPHKHLQVTNLPYLFTSSSNSLHEHWLGKTTDCWLGGGGGLREGFKLSLLSAIWDSSQQHSLKDNKFTYSHQIKQRES